MKSMLGLILLYFIGKKFYDLALEYDKKGWPYALIGIASYYGGAIIAGIIAVIIMEINAPGKVDEMDDTILGLMAMPFGLIICVAVYFLIKRNFESKATNAGMTYILDNDLMTDYEID